MSLHTSATWFTPLVSNGRGPVVVMAAPSGRGMGWWWSGLGGGLLVEPVRDLAAEVRRPVALRRGDLHDGIVAVVVLETQRPAHHRVQGVGHRDVGELEDLFVAQVG